MSLRSKLSLRVASVLSVGLTLLGVIVHLLLQAVLTREVDELLAARGTSIAADVRFSVARGLTPTIGERPESGQTFADELATPGLYIQVTSADGAIVARSPSLGSAALPVDASIMARMRPEDAIISTVPLEQQERVRVHLVAVGVGERSLFVQVGQSMHFIDSAIRGVDEVLAVTAVLMFTVILIFTWIGISRTLQALGQITAAAETIARTGDVEHPIPSIPGTDEAGRLSGALRGTTARLRHLLDLQRNLLADTAHELRNPLTVMHTNLDLLSLELDARTRTEVAAESLAEADRMRRLVDDLLLLAEVEAQVARPEENVRLDELTRSVRESLREPTSEVRLDITALEPLVVKGSAEQLRRALLNLIENAIRYGDEKVHVTVSVRREGRVGVLEVSDTGPGIAAEHLPHIFDRFYRVDPARRRSTGGTGLGLAIVREIVTSHGGQVQVVSTPGKGSTFRITLPAEPSWAPLASVESVNSAEHHRHDAEGQSV